MGRAVRNLRSRADEGLALPVGKQFRAGARCGTRAASSREEAQGILWERQAETGGFGGELRFQFRWAVAHAAHGYSSPLLPLYQERSRSAPTPRLTPRRTPRPPAAAVGA